MQHTINAFRISPLEERLWSLSQESNGYRAYCSLELAGPLQRDRLFQALRTVWTRHEFFQTRFGDVPGLNFPLQVRADQPFISQPVYDLRGIEVSERPQVVRQVLDAL